MKNTEPEDIEMIYTVVCTDLNDYVNWQVELLEYSWSRINQPGKLIRLVACEEDAVLPTHRHAEVYRTRATNSQPGSDDVYPPFNRLYSLQQWLAEQDIEGTILVVDCDVVFTQALKTRAPKGAPLAQHWLDYHLGNDFKKAIQSISDADVTEFQAATWPMLINADDLRKVLPRWIEATVAIREETKRQESDMFALLLAANEISLKFQLSGLTAFMPWPDEDVAGASLIHYCQVVKDNSGERVWGKWRYQPWQTVPNPKRAKLDYCKDLLERLNEFAQLKNHEERHQSSTIFIGIASYCDAELVDTIQSCLQKARYPENLRFGICHQYDNAEELTNEHCLDQFSQDRRFRYLLYDFRESHGGCWARNLTQQLYNNETYTLQVDSHTQMVESWDTLLIEMLESLPSDKPLITQSPPLYSIEPEGKNYFYNEDLSLVSTAVATQWSTGGWLDHTQKMIPENNHFPRCTRMLSCGFVFTTGEWNQKVSNDPKYLYVGEEFALTLRSFTHGYDLFEPSQIVCWHRLHPTHNRKFRNDHSVEVCRAKHDLAVSRLQLLMAGDPNTELGEFGLGSERTLEDYARLTGIDCVNKTLTLAAQEGEFLHPDRIAGLNEEDDVVTEEANIETIIDVTIHTNNMAPLMLACYETTPVLISLFDALKNRTTKPDDVIYLELGENGQETVYFKNKQLVSIETSPALSEDFFSQLPVREPLSEATDQVEAPPLAGDRIRDDWKIWAWHNISRGSSKDEIFKGLVEAGFAWATVRTELGYEPAVPLDQIAKQPVPAESQYEANPIAQRLENAKLEIYQIDEFLNRAECEALFDIIEENHLPSKVAGDAGAVASEHRTSSTCCFDDNDPKSKLAKEVRLRLCKLIGINPSYAEPIQGQLYDKGGEYKAHFDWFDPGTDSFYLEAAASKGGQRTWSAVIYLNDVPAGGETRFEDADITVFPKQGRVVFWNNLDQNNVVSQNAKHQACPVLEGQKAILTLWFRTFGEGEMFTRKPFELIPAFTPVGLEKRTMSKGLFKRLSDVYKSSSVTDRIDEFVPGGFLQNEASPVPSELIDIPQALRQEIINEFLPVCQQWSQTDLEFSALYGMRVYARGTTLKMHTDTQATHIISVILNIAQQVDEAWPLEIEDHVGRRHSILMQPGDIILYEGARLAHGRPEPFNGDYYANVFLHFHPKD